MGDDPYAALMRPEHLLLCYFGTGVNQDVLRQTAELCEMAGARLSLVLPVVDATIPDGCCGIQGEHWRRLTDEDTRDAARRAVELLSTLGCPPANVAIESGASVAEIARRAAARYGCDAVAIARKRRPWSSGGLSRRHLTELRREVRQEIFEFS
jgi:nucleotide-binding universal stress UspA family protein